MTQWTDPLSRYLQNFRLIAVSIFSLVLWVSPAHATIDPAEAESIFKQAQSICSRDAGALWRHTLCGPMLLVDPEDLSAVANTADAGGVLRHVGNVFVGSLPSSVTVSDTTVTWSGTRWCELMWPWPMREDTDMRHVTLAHEMFHRIEAGELHIQVLDGDNTHLDTRDGRLIMEMEWRALGAALEAPTVELRKGAVEDAVLFRRQRYKLFPRAAKDEAALKSNEGIAEYTGVRLGLATAEERKRYALRDLSAYLDAPSLIRSFAYANGPAWGLLLDQASPDWRREFLRDQLAQRFDQRLSAALSLTDPDLARLNLREAIYDPEGRLRVREVARDQERRTKAAEYALTLVTGPILTLPLADPNFQFKPQTLVALKDVGTVYPTITLKDDWGTLIVEEVGLLMTEICRWRQSRHEVLTGSHRADLVFASRSTQAGALSERSAQAITRSSIRPLTVPYGDHGCEAEWGYCMVKIGSIVWGVRDMSRAIAFWSAALEYKPLREPEEDWAILVPQKGDGPQLALKLITSAAARRHHLDLYASDKAAETERLLALGAQRVNWEYPLDADYPVLADPDGNRFCVIEKSC